MIQRIFNRAKDLLFIRPLLPYWRKRLNGKAMVYLYHRIGEQGEHSFLDQGGSPIVSAAEFQKDIQSLKKMGGQFVRFSDLAKCDYDSGQFYVVICADDGFASNYKAGHHVVETEGVPQTIFQCASMLATAPMLWEHKLYFLYHDSSCAHAFKAHLNEHTQWPSDCDQIRETIHPFNIEREMDEFLESRTELSNTIKNLTSQIYPSERQIRQSVLRGHEIASHGDRHLKRTSIGDDEFITELESAKRKLGEITDQSISAFSYPFNSYLDGDGVKCSRYYSMVATVDGGAVDKTTTFVAIPRNTFPGPAKNSLRHRRWLLTGSI